MSKPIFEPNTYDTTSDDYSISDAASKVSENSHTSWQNWASHTTEEVTPAEPTVTAGTSQRGQVRTMSQRMAESVSQQNFDKDQGHPVDYVGVHIKKLKDGSSEFTQQALIDSIIHDVRLKDGKVKPVPGKVSLQLHAFKDEPAFDLNFNYRSAVGKLNYLAQTTRPDIMYALLQIAKYSSYPRQSHGNAILYLVRYLKKTHDLGLKFKPDPKKGFECYCGMDFSGNWNSEFAPVDPSTAKSQSRWIIFYAGCPISWASKLQSHIALSTTEAKYIAMSQALCDLIPIMTLLQEMREQNFKVTCIEPYVYCKVFEVLKTMQAL
jgi:hypothetical protein